MASERISIRLPDEYVTALRAAAEAGGYSSPGQLARCVLVRFLNFRERVRPDDRYTEWAETLVADHLDPRRRSDINERL